MPVSAPKPCTYPGCPALVTSGRCDKHPYDKGQSTARQRQASRRYATNDPRWRLIRKKQLARQPACAMCEAEGRLTPANVVDHIDGDAYNNNTNNLQSLCWSCHSRKTAEENGGFGNA